MRANNAHKTSCVNLDGTASTLYAAVNWTQVIVTCAMDGEVRLHTAPFTSQNLTDCVLTSGKRIHAVEVCCYAFIAIIINGVGLRPPQGREGP